MNTGKKLRCLEQYTGLPRSKLGVLGQDEFGGLDRSPKPQTKPTTLNSQTPWPEPPHPESFSSKQGVTNVLDFGSPQHYCHFCCYSAFMTTTTTTSTATVPSVLTTTTTATTTIASTAPTATATSTITATARTCYDFRGY